MALLSDAQRADLCADMQRMFPPGNLSITKGQLRDVVNALDAWFDANASGANAAIPQPQRGLLPSAFKAWVLARVIERRYITGA